MAEEWGWMTDWARNYLDEHNLWVEKRHHCYANFVKSGEYFTGDTTVTYIDVEMWGPEDSRYMQLSSQEQEVDSGTYRISFKGKVSFTGNKAVVGKDSKGNKIVEDGKLYGETNTATAELRVQ